MGAYLLFAAAVVSLLAAASWILAVTSLEDVKIWRRLSESEVEVGDVVTARLVVHNRKRRPAPWIFWSDEVQSGVDVEGETAGLRNLSSGEKAHRSYRIHTVRRGLFRVGPVVLESSGPFGCIRRVKVDQAASFLTVLPQAVDLARGWPLGHRPVHEVPRRRSLFEDPSRFQGIREYRSGDSLRRVHWRATARTGDLQVKLFEPSVLEGIHLVVDLHASNFGRHGSGAGDGNGRLEAGAEAAEDGWIDPLTGVDPVLELAITAAASLARFVLDGGQRVAVLANGGDAADGNPEVELGTFRRLDEAVAVRGKSGGFHPLALPADRGADHWRRIRALLARATPADGPSVAETLAIELPRLPRSLVTLVVTPRLDGALVSVLWALRRSGIETGIVRVGPEGPLPRQALPQDTQVWRVRDAEELRDLGSRIL
ncbi:MAG: DUF58 domain-containing protein [Thermoanaerobaculia bacterium]|nr:DUF58 domain-containing protein [Thermoanaerobaculia bacterium]